jgi:putative flavoprotein involved in K+ transport
VPRRYRGKDINWWSNVLGLYDRTVDQLKFSREKFGAKPHISGTKGGHTLNLHQFAIDGVTLVGRVTELSGTTVKFAHDLYKNLTAADQFEANLVARIDSYIEKNGLSFPEEILPELTAGFEHPEKDDLDLAQAGVSTVIWATGYSFDFSMVRLPVFDPDGYPIQQQGVTSYPGLYFVGLPWLHNAKSGLLFGVSEDAAHITSHIINREQPGLLDWSRFAEREDSLTSWT